MARSAFVDSEIDQNALSQADVLVEKCRFDGCVRPSPFCAVSGLPKPLKPDATRSDSTAWRTG
jgi:hypothetical protein